MSLLVEYLLYPVSEVSCKKARTNTHTYIVSFILCFIMICEYCLELCCQFEYLESNQIHLQHTVYFQRSFWPIFHCLWLDHWIMWNKWVGNFQKHFRIVSHKFGYFPMVFSSQLTSQVALSGWIFINYSVYFIITGSAVPGASFVPGKNATLIYWLDQWVQLKANSYSSKNRTCRAYFV